MCQKNIGRLDAYIRISTGIVITSMGIMRDKGWLTVLGGMKIAEGVTRYCPMLDIMGLSTISDEEILEDILGFDCDDEFEDDYENQPEFEHNEHECMCNHDNEDERRQYPHRNIKRNQYQNR